jgi:hypothetical protein
MASVTGHWLQFLSMRQSKYVYSFKSAVGAFWIRPERDQSCGLYIGDESTIELLGYYDSGFGTADAVRMQTTGWDEWDSRAHNDAPPTLLAWRRKLMR